MNFRVALFHIALLVSARLFAGDYPAFRADLQPGAFCDIAIKELHPTQFNVGKIEVEKRAKKIAKMPDWKLATYMNNHILPVVIGPGGAPFVTDHHHFACAIAGSGRSDVVHARILGNFRELGDAEFWTRMKRVDWVYLLDKGEGPKDPHKLPQHLADMSDDPFRSLAWAVRDRGGYGIDDNAAYADFHWADFFRTRMKIGDGKEGFDHAVDEALKLAHSPEAKDLPGYGLKPEKE